MEAVGRLAGGVAHDMNNTLGAIMGFASVMQAEVKPDNPHLNDIKQILNASRKGRDLMLNLLGFARRGKYRRERFSLENCINDVIALLKHTISKKIRIKKHFAAQPVRIFGDPTQIHHALMNICLNAADAMGNNGTLTIDTDIVYVNDKEANFSFGNLSSGTYAKLSVSDTGSGMDAKVMAKAFEPFFTTKPIGKGTGLGLPMVYGTVQNHGGAVALESVPAEGTIVTLLLPASQAESDTTNTLNERRTPSDLSLTTILMIDDEAIVRKAGKRILQKLGYSGSSLLIWTSLCV